jgi:TolB protein
MIKAGKGTKSILVAAIALFVPAAMQEAASQDITISAARGNKTSINWNSFQGETSQASRVFTQTLKQDLLRSGWFSEAPEGRGEVTLAGVCREVGGSLQIECRVTATVSKKTYLNEGYRAAVGESRRTAHLVADAILLAVKKKPGMASSRLVMIGTRSGKKELYLADSDGQGLVQMTQDHSVSVAPKWGPNEQIVYTSYLEGYPDVYLINVLTGARERISNFAGLNTGADISPDGRDIVLVLSKDGNPELYVKNLRGGKPTQITSTRNAGEASPSWSPDGMRIVYVSDSSGRPQIYEITRSGGRGKRLTPRGTENVSPDWGSNGQVTYCTKSGGRYQIAILHPDTGENRIISVPDGADYEDPSWAPDGRHVACTRTVNHRPQVYLLDTMGDPPIALTNYKGDWYSPSWSPK